MADRAVDHDAGRGFRSPLVSPMSQTLAAALLLVLVPLPLLPEIHPHKTRNQEDSETRSPAGENISKPNLHKHSQNGATEHYTPS